MGNQTGGNQVQLKNLLRIQEGFTLIELLAVMAIVATLAGIVATQVSGTGDTSKDVQTKQDATTVGTAVADYFSDQEGAAIKTPQSVTVFDQAGIIVTTNSQWPEIPVTALTAYGNVFQETRSEVGAIAFFDEEGNPSVLSVRGLLASYNAVDFAALIDGILSVGARVEVKAVMAEDGLTATKIKVKQAEEVKIDGTIDALDDAWVDVEGTVILITPDTEIDGILSVGARVEVKAVMAEDGLTATKIKVKRTG